MSRFGLRSNSDTLKLTEEKASSKKLSGTGKVALKRASQKRRKSVSSSNETQMSGTSSLRSAEEDKSQVSIVCSLPLNRLSGFIEKLNAPQTNSKLITKQNENSEKNLKKERDRAKDKDKEKGKVRDKQKDTEKAKEKEKKEEDVEEQSERDPDEDDVPLEDGDGLSLEHQIVRILCLYCDKKFTSYKMQLKHVEKFHIQHKDRRCSGRTSQPQTHAETKKQHGGSAANVGSSRGHYPGCTFCKRTKTQQITATAKDLNALFLHLTECHGDKYFGCKVCVQRFPNTIKLSKHMQSVHKDMSYVLGDCSKIRSVDVPALLDKSTNLEKNKSTKVRMLKTQKPFHGAGAGISGATSVPGTPAINSNTIIGAEEPILSRLGLTQNRLPNNRKGVRLRRESIIADALLKPDQPAVYTSAVKPRNKSGKSTVSTSNSCDAEVVFRVPTRTEILSCVYDDNFYREVVSNVRNNLLYHLDGKMQDSAASAIDVKQSVESSLMKQQAPTIRSTLVESPLVLHSSGSGSGIGDGGGASGGALDSEIHAATSLTATTAFPTLLTAEQYGGDTAVTKIRRPHTKNSWKWKWDSVKKFKLINEGGKIVKKMKQPMLGLRDLSKLDMWTQLTMRQKHELLQQRAASECTYSSVGGSSLVGVNDSTREEKQRLNEQLNFILDMRLLPHIILEQNEQAIIKVENDEFGITPRLHHNEEDGADNIMSQTFADESFLSLLQLLPHDEQLYPKRQLVLSGEWARPRCYLCMCCGAKFEKLKSLEEHKMFRHSHILSTHYEVVGRELLAGNLLRHLFIPNRALSYYGNEEHNCTNLLRRLGGGWNKDDATSLVRRTTNMTPEDDSSDSIQSMLNSCTTNTYSVKHSTTTDECDTDTKTTLDINTVSPSHSMQSSNSSFMTPMARLKAKAKEAGAVATHCTKCKRKCSGILDLYRHMLDCSGDYIWTLAKKRKYRYYCGSKKRRPCNKHNFSELRKTKQKCVKSSQVTNDTEESASNFSKIKTPPRPRPSDAESIKKMLENLPPKRVCKKIFPTVTKTKKSKLIVKHKIYNPQGRLRKTRARQISQARLLSKKTKGKFCNKNGKNKNRRVLQHRNKQNTEVLKKERKDQAKHLEDSKTGAQVSGSNEISSKMTQFEKVKEKNPRTSKESATQIQVSENKQNALDEFIKSPKETMTTRATAVINQVPMKAQTEMVAIPKEQVIGDVASVRRVCDSLRSSKSIPQQQQSVESQKHSTECLAAPSAISTVSPPLENTNCSKKRSKKINDCIAMLTGKLEEKLKTEQHVTNKSEPCGDAEAGGDGKMKCSDEKKLPKRKTISRRIIKVDNVSAKSQQAEAPPKETPHNTISICPASISKGPPASVPVLVASAVPTSLPIPLPPSAVAAAAAATMVGGAALPHAIPIPVNMLPKLPLYMPVEKFRAVAAVVPTSMGATVPPTQLAMQQKLAVPPQLTMQPPLAMQPQLASQTQLLPQPQLSAQPQIPAQPQLPPPPPQLAAQTLAAPVPPLPLNVPVQNVPTKVVQTPPISTVLPVAQSILQPPAPPVATAPLPPLFNAEPLNLSSAKKFQKQNASQDMSCATTYRSGIPARRQTICGFEARNFIVHDEMEPLDLSKKCTKDVLQKPMPMPDVLPVAPLMTPAAQSVAPIKAIDAALMPTVVMGGNVTLSPDAVLNKQFYSNLDLLKIPQVRSYVPPANEAINLNTKCPVKKRGSGKNVNECNSKPVVANNAGKKESVGQKKESVGKGKFIPKMDDEVINHIDDAINSVINAVKASLQDNDKEQQEQQPVSNMMQTSKEMLMQPVLPIRAMTTTVLPVESLQTAVMKSNDESRITTNTKTNILINVGSMGLTSTPLKHLTPQKRCVRSKTMDCRPAFLMMSEATDAENVQPTCVLPESPPKQVVSKDDTYIVNNQVNIVKPITERTNVIEKSAKEQCAAVELVPADIEPVENTETSTISKAQTSEIGESKLLNSSNSIEEPPKTTVETVKEPPVEKCNSPTVIETSHETSANLISEENISNINNTSSGFHSSGQVECLVEAKKKQRRRRKNELAAIVADQLLESFKIDKTRRDNLKKLENLAYEKSEDLLLTGMLLMSSTKRNVSSSFQTVQPSNDAVLNKSVENTKRQKHEQTKNARGKNKTTGNVHNDAVDKGTCAKEKAEKIVEVTSVPEPAVVSVEKEEKVEFRRGRRRQYRRKGKALDNENISKLKSSLESFSIGIEKQLSELEAKNANMFNATEPKTRSSTATKTLLRPSILSVTLEQPKAQAGESKTVVSSRDPRLNKNIHKEEKDGVGDTTRSDKRIDNVDEHERNLTEIGDLEEDNYLTEIAKNVNEKIMAADENEDFAFASDGFEIGNELQDDSNSKFYRPPTSMSVRSAPNFNDDHSNFGSICDENTNTEVMDMDLDDELSVYTSYSQDVGRGRGRRRRRRRSILLTRRPKKRITRDSSAEKFECSLCHKTFFTANSLTKHNMTLAHVSKVSAQEYLMSKTMQGTFSEQNNTSRIPTFEQSPNVQHSKETKELPLETVNAIAAPHNLQVDLNILNNGEMKSMPLEGNKDKDSYNVAPRLTLNPDERLFFECCNILKGTETPRLNNEDCNNGATYTYAYRDKTQPCASSANVKSMQRSDGGLQKKQTAADRNNYKSLPPHNMPAIPQQQHVFRDPPAMHTGYNKMSHVNAIHEQRLLSPNYSAVSQFSAVTNTTSRFKTKAAMKGYENTNVDLTVHQELETKSRTVCKLTELAEIALGTEKPNSPEYTSLSNHQQEATHLKHTNAGEYMTLSVAEQQKQCNAPLNRGRPKNNETQSSTSSKTIMHSSIIKAAVEEHNKVPCDKIVIPDRPFKNIGLEEKETITFQKPKTSVNLLTDDNSVSTASYSDRDDFDFGSMSDDDSSVKTNNERNIKNNSDSSSSRATAKTFENKSLIMGRIFKNASTKTKAAVKVQSVGVQKDPPPKADLDQLFDELRGDGVGKSKSSLEGIPNRREANQLGGETVQSNCVQAKPETGTTRTPKESRKKRTNMNAKAHKDITKLQSELGMSQEEIVKLIDEGQRKSKRRCATNRPKKLVEMWSSDEYEEFLSTKDIIALIEEKEKQEKRRKRKNSINQSNASDNKEKGDADSMQLVDNKRKSVRSSNLGERREKLATATAHVLVPAPTPTSTPTPTPKQLEKLEREPDSSAASSITKAGKSATASSSLEGRAKYTRSTAAAESATNPKSNVSSKINHNSTSNRLNNKKNNNTASKLSGGREEAAPTKNFATNNDTAKPTRFKELPECTKGMHALPNDDDNYVVAELKRNNHRTRSSKERKYGICREDANNLKAFNKELGATEVPNKKHNVNNNNNNNNNQSYKSKRKTQSNQSPPRRKRLASEKLYYWSSSSDEDFGRINTECEQEFDGGEQYQKHGWIVGDSHKKLVTLLAIAKGNKKVDNCGVKKNVCKRKS